jgi:hypothetical protein
LPVFLNEVCVVAVAPEWPEAVNSKPEPRLHVDLVVKGCVDGDYLIYVISSRWDYHEWDSTCVVMVGHAKVHSKTPQKDWYNKQADVTWAFLLGFE